MDHKNSEIIYKRLREANFVEELYNVPSFPSPLSITSQRSCQMRDESGFP